MLLFFVKYKLIHILVFIKAPLLKNLSHYQWNTIAKYMLVFIKIPVRCKIIKKKIQCEFLYLTYWFADSKWWYILTDFGFNPLELRLWRIRSPFFFFLFQIEIPSLIKFLSNSFFLLLLMNHLFIRSNFTLN